MPHFTECARALQIHFSLLSSLLYAPAGWPLHFSLGSLTLSFQLSLTNHSSWWEIGRWKENEVRAFIRCLPTTWSHWFGCVPWTQLLPGSVFHTSSLQGSGPLLLFHVQGQQLLCPSQGIKASIVDFLKPCPIFLTRPFIKLSSKCPVCLCHPFLTYSD